MNGLRLALEQLSSVSIATSLYLRADEATYFVPRTFVQAGGPHPDLDLIQGRLFRSIIAEECVQSPLCVNRPEPRKHNGELLWDSPGKDVVFRPDRFVAAACDSDDELDNVGCRLKESLFCRLHR